MDMMDNILCIDCGETVDSFHVCDTWNTVNDEEGITLYTSVQNIEELINEVFIRSPLWDSTLPYRKRGPSVIKSLWSEIDKKLNLEPGTASTKWRNLRDTYIRKLSEQNKYIPSGSSADARAKHELWPYFDLLGFLRPTVTRRKTFSNIKPLTSCNNDKFDTEQPSVQSTSSSTTLTYYDSDGCSNDNTFSQEVCRTPSCDKSETGTSEKCLIRNYKQQNFRPGFVGTALKETSCKSNIDVEQSKKTNIYSLKNFNETAPIKVPQASAGKRRRTSGNKENDLSLLQQSLLSEIKTTNDSINTVTDPVVTFCNYLATQLRTLSPENFKKYQRDMLSLLFKLQDS